VRFAEHGVGLADTGRRAKVYAQLPALPMVVDVHLNIIHQCICPREQTSGAALHGGG
jgi:hypothetical protein